MTRWSWAVLVFELLLITIILILPQVDIPDTAFHCGTAPVLAKARLTSQPPQTQAGPDPRPVLQSKVNRAGLRLRRLRREACLDRKSTRLNSSHLVISYAVFCLKKKNSDEA